MAFACGWAFSEHGGGVPRSSLKGHFLRVSISSEPSRNCMAFYDPALEILWHLVFYSIA